MNKAGRYASNKEVDELALMNIIYELTEKERMVMWSQGYIDVVIDKLPDYAKGILVDRKKKWEDTMGYVMNQIDDIVQQDDFVNSLKGERKDFAMFVMRDYPQYQSLLFHYYDGKLKESDFRNYVYRNRFGAHKSYLH